MVLAESYSFDFSDLLSHWVNRSAATNLLTQAVETEARMDRSAAEIAPASPSRPMTEAEARGCAKQNKPTPIC